MSQYSHHIARGNEPWLDSRHHANLPEKVRQADIVVAAVGQAEMIKGDWIKPGATVIDVGTTRVERDGKKRLVGDVEFEAAARTAAAITLVPGGVGPMTIMTLMHNTVVAAHRRSRLAVPQLWYSPPVERRFARSPAFAERSSAATRCRSIHGPISRTTEQPYGLAANTRRSAQ